MNKSHRIRRARLEDARGIADCVDSAYRHYIERIGKPPGPMLENYVEVIKKDRVYVAEAERIVGVLVLKMDSETFLLDNIAVHPGHQGKGLGKHLLGIAESEAMKYGFRRIQLYTHQAMSENLLIYQSLGYVETGKRNVDGYDRIYLEKELSA